MTPEEQLYILQLHFIVKIQAIEGLSEYDTKHYEFAIGIDKLIVEELRGHKERLAEYREDSVCDLASVLDCGSVFIGEYKEVINGLYWYCYERGFI